MHAPTQERKNRVLKNLNYLFTNSRLFGVL